MKVWIVTREYNGIAEAGGVKVVSCSLSEALFRTGNEVTVFMPLYACTDRSFLKDYEEDFIPPVKVYASGKLNEVRFDSALMNGVKFVFIKHPLFAERQAVYTYTQKEAEENPGCTKGSGHKESLLMNVIFQKAVIAYGYLLDSDELPEVIHGQDATAALTGVFARNEIFGDENFAEKNDFSAVKNNSVRKNVYESVSFTVTIHNSGPGYHHEFPDIKSAVEITGLPEKLLEKGLNGKAVEPFLLAQYCSRITTVSPVYAQEILKGTTDTAGLSEGFNKCGTEITGITNGIDFERYNPEDKKHSLLPFEFNPGTNELEGKYSCRNYFINQIASEKNNPVSEQHGYEKYGFLLPENKNSPDVYFTYHGRIVSQKGIQILVTAADKLLESEKGISFIFMGQGQPELEDAVKELTQKYKGRAVFLKGYSRSIARLCTASADFAVLPSEFEPCGLEDFIAQLYASIPVAHATGGLCKILNEKTGFLYKPNTPEVLYEYLLNLTQKKKSDPSCFNEMISYAYNYVKREYSWDSIVEKQYLPVYKKN